MRLRACLALALFLAAPAAHAAHKVFVNFDGLVMRSGLSDATMNQSPFVACADAVEYPAYVLSDEARRDVLGMVRYYLADFDVEVADVRPSGNAYTMVMVGGSAGRLCQKVAAAGLSPVDCGNAQPSDIAFVFADTMRGPRDLAAGVGHELGHAVGLEHTNSSADLMYPTGGYVGYEAGAVIVAEGALGHTYHFERSACDGHEDQNSYARVMAAFGPAKTPPAWGLLGLAIEVAPDGRTLRLAATHGTSRLLVSNLDIDVDGGAFLVRGEPTDDGTAAVAWHLRPGVHQVRATATDRLGQSATASLDFVAPGAEAACTTDASCGWVHGPQSQHDQPFSCDHGRCVFGPVMPVEAGCSSAPRGAHLCSLALVLLAFAARRRVLARRR